MKRKHDNTLSGKKLRPESLMMTYGYKPELSEGALKTPIFQTSTFVFKSAEDGKAFFELAYGQREKRPSESAGLIYSRLNNPNIEVLEDRLTLWDEAQACLVFESGMAAISTVLLEFLRPGDVVVFSEPVYGGTEHVFNQLLPGYGIEAHGFPCAWDEEEISKWISDQKWNDRVAMIYLETPANPTNGLVDIAACARIAKKLSKKKSVLTVVDNTFLGPLWQQPLKHGADLVVYSATKFIGGHSDVIAGVVLGNTELIDRIRALRTFLGTLASPWTGWLLLRSLETLKLRMTCQMKNARFVADFLADHPKVEKTYFLGHIKEGSREHELFRRQCLSAGSMISFDLYGGEKEAFRFLNALKLIKLAVSLGGTESLAEHPYTMTHADVAKDLKKRLGITPKMIRLSIGVEHPEDLVTDLAQALEKT